MQYQSLEEETDMKLLEERIQRDGIVREGNVDVYKRQEPVLVDQLIVQAGQVFGMAGSQHLRAGEEADGPADVGILSLIHIFAI